jgi:SAM-dependent methyltransferase
MCNPWDPIAQKRHRQLVQGHDTTFFKLLLPTILKVLQEQKDHSTFRILDVGCGTGFLTRILAEHTCYVVGVDPSTVSANIATEYTSENGNVAIESCSIEDYGENCEGWFDFAIAHMSFQAIENLDPALMSISRSLKTSGGLLFSIPHPCFWALIKAEIGQDGYLYHIPSSHENSLCVGNDSVVPVPYFHRPLRSYGTVLNKTGFVIERIIEPFPDDELMKSYRRPWVYPGFLMMLCRKVKRCGG